MLTLREKFIWNRHKNDKVAAKAYGLMGRPHFVVPTTAQDSDFTVAMAAQWARENHGYVYDSLKLAHDACVDGRGDAIIPLPGVHTVATASLAMSKTGVKIIGPEAWMGIESGIPSAILTTSIAGDEIANITAPDCGLIGVTIRPITAAKGIDFSAAANGLLVDQCYFDMFTPAVNVATVGLAATGEASFVKIINSRFHSDGAQGNAIVATALLNSFIGHCEIWNDAGTWASAILVGAATAGLHIHKSRFACYGTAMTVGINGTGATIASGVLVSKCIAGSLVTKLVDNFDAGECEISENYDAGVGGSDGGVLITAIT